MKRAVVLSCLAAMLGASCATAQTTLFGNSPNLTLQSGQDAPLNRFGVSYRMGFNISVDFKNLGGFAHVNDPGPAVTNTSHFYDNGYNMPDNNNTGRGLTWNWGFSNANQVVGDDLFMSSAGSQGDASRRADGDPQHGFELTYARQLGTVKNCRWGLQGAFNFTDLTARDDRRLLGTATRTTDRFSLLFTNAQGNLDRVDPFTNGMPYRGTFEGPGPLITNAPAERVEETFSGGAAIVGHRQFDAAVFGFRFGPYLEVPLTDRCAFSIAGGLALVEVSSDFRFRETVTVSGNMIEPQFSSGSGSRDGLLVGGYVAGSVSYALNGAWTVFAGAQYQNVGTYTHRENGRKAVLDLGESVFVTAGVGFSF
jgi:hypothetical protein